ncbi:MAG: ComEC/Rec2 family competence protein, partial [Limisphaerales bacterium]
MEAALEKIAKHPLPAPAFWAALAFAAGIFTSALTTNHLLFWFVFSAGSGLFAAFFHLRFNNAAANFSVLILLAGLGALRYSAATDVVAGRSVANFAGLDRRMFISGRVCELPDIKPDRTRIYLDKIVVGWKSKIELEGRIRLSIGQPVSAFAVGDRIEFVAFLDSLWKPSNLGALDFARLMRIRGVEGAVYLKDAKGVSIAARSSGNWRSRLTKVRDLVEQKLTQGLPPKAAGVIKGFVLGDTRDIEPSTYELFRKTGTLHLLAVSGTNVAWVALLPILFLKLFYLSLRWRYLAALALVWVFVLLTDLQASVLRAAIMFTFWTASKVVFREVSGVQSLGLSALFLLCVNPLWFFDIGFELSYLAAFALISFSFKELDSFDLRSLKSRFLSFVTTPLVAFLATFPLIAFYFNQVTPVSLLSNLFAVPLALLITWSAFLFGFLNFLNAGSLLAGGPVFLFETLFWIQEVFTGHPFFHFAIPHPDGWTAFLLFLTAFALLVFVFKSEWRKAGAYLLLSGLIPLVWLPALKEKLKFSLSILEARGEIVSVLSLPEGMVVVGGGEVRETQHTPRQVLEPFLAYLGKDGIDGYLP